MIVFPCCKINLGLNVIRKRSDGYHNLSTVFYPLSLNDRLEIKIIENSIDNTNITLTGIRVKGNTMDNLVIKAYKLLDKDFSLPNLSFYLKKNIPSQAGLGGGSSDAAFALNAINELCGLNISCEMLRQYAVKLGADCPFFINPVPSYATGIGEILKPLEKPLSTLNGKYIVLIKPTENISTKQAFQYITPFEPKVSCLDIVSSYPVEEWKELLVNDFEKSIFKVYPKLKMIKAKLYDMGAIYAQMSGSGSCFFGVLNKMPNNLANTFTSAFTYACKL